MQAYHVKLEHPVSTSFRCQRAADSLDIDTSAKSVHEFNVAAEIDTPYNVGLIVGASGSGKTTLADQVWGAGAMASALDLARPVIEQFPEDWTYDQCVGALTGMGLTSVPCWIRPAHTLSNGQRARADAALLLARSGMVVVDEWTSVVDRTVAKAMSHCIQKHARRTRSTVVLLSCHYDVVEWLNPDWIIDCNTQTFTDRRSLWRDFERQDKLSFDICETDRRTWKMFSRYHYLSDRLPGGKIYTFGVFHGADQIAFQCFAQYVPHPRGSKRRQIWHSNRTVVHPDYVGLGLGMRIVNMTCAHMAKTYNYRLMGKFSSGPMIRAVEKDPNWKILRHERQLSKASAQMRSGNIERGMDSVRSQVRTVTVEYVGARNV